MKLGKHPQLPEHLEHSYSPVIGKLSVRGIKAVPEELLSIADDVKILDLSDTEINSLPDEFSRLQNLEVIFASRTNFRQIPPVLGVCPKLTTIGMQSCHIDEIAPDTLPTSLKALLLTDNAITALPTSISKLIRLQKLTLTLNRLQELPETLLACENLELVRLAGNHLKRQPDWLLTHPALAWYADAGNPYSLDFDSTPTTEIAWGDIEIAESLSSNHKNTVHKAKLTSSGEAVAIKLYGRTMNADGNNEDEIQASIAAHPDQYHRVVGAPHNQLGLAMPYINSSFRQLAAPPSLRSVTRDIYPQDQTFSADFVATLLRQLAVQLKNLHEKGIMHGDVYAHNILANKAGECYLMDFGAASRYEQSDVSRREQVEVLAFGYIANELSSRTRESLPASITEVVTGATATNPQERPPFSEIAAILS